MPDVVLTIRVKDGEVVNATKNVQNLEKAAQKVGGKDYGLRQTRATMAPDEEERQKRLNKWMGKDLPKAAEDAKSAIAGVDASAAGAAQGLSGMAASAGPAAVILGVVAAAAVVAVVAAVALAKQMLDASKAFADYALEVGKAAEETGLATETVAALKHEAAATGRSFSDVAGPIGNFRKLIGEAAAGSEDATKKLRSLGIDGSKAIYDIDGAFKVAVANIVKAPEGINQVRLAFNAFGEDGYKIIPFLKDFHGNVDAAVKRAEELGLSIGGKDVAAAKEFNRAYEDLKKVILGITYTFGREFLPGVTKALKGVGEWVISNKDTIKEWATSVGSWVTWLVEHWNTFAGIVKNVANSIAYVTRLPLPEATRGQTALPVARPNYDPALNPQGPPQVDLAALEAARAAMERKMQETIERTKKGWDAAIESWQLFGSEAGKSLTDVFGKLKEQFDELGDANQFRSGVKTAIDQYLADINRAYTELEQLEDEKDRRNNVTANEVNLTELKQMARRREYGAAAVKIQQTADAAIAAHSKKLTNDQLREAEEAMRKRIEIAEQRDASDMENHAYALQTMQIDDQQYLDFQKKYALEALEYRKQQLQDFLSKYSVDAKKRAGIEGDIAQLNGEIAQQKLRNERALTAAGEARLAVLREIKKLENDNADPAKTATRRSDLAKQDELQLKRQIQGLNDALANGGINDGLVIQSEHLRDILEMRNRELDAVIRINRAQLELAHSQEISNNQIRASVYEHMAAASNLNDAISNGINNTFDAISGQLDKQLDKLNDWSHGMLSFITEPLKAMAHKQLSDVFSGVLDSLFPGAGLGELMNQTNNPVAQPIVKKIDETNKLLSQLVASTGQVPAAGGLGGLTGLLSGVLGGGSGGGGGLFSGSSGGLIYNAAGGGSNELIRTLMSEGSNAAGAPGSPGSGGILANLGKIFSTKPGGIFGKDGFGFNAGTYGTIGTIAQLAGGMVGGRLGNVLTYAGLGLSIGGPIGAGIGALVGLFMGDPKKKKDEKENMPQLQKGFSDATSQLQQILNDIRTGSDPDAGLSKAREIRAQIASGFGIQFGSKKYQKQSAQAIAQQLATIDAQPDGLMAQIIAAAEIARGSADRNKRILPEFAGGNYFADYFRPNGLLPGMFDGADDILAMISRGEMVLNPMQQNRIRAIAGGDVFEHAGIPNYPRGSMSSKLAGGGVANTGLALSAGPTNVTVNPKIVLEGVSFNEGARAYIESDDGKRTVVSMLTKETGLKPI